VLIRLFQTARRFDMEVQPQLVLLQKTLLNIEGLGRQLYPELDLWATAKPYLETWFKDRLHPLTAAQRAWRNAPGWLEKAPQLPDMVFAALKSYQTNEASQSLQMMQIQTALQQSQRAENKRQWRWLASLCLVAGFAIPSMQPTLTAWVPALYLGASIFVFLSFRG